MEDRRIVELYWQRSEQAIAETAEKYGSRLRRLGEAMLEDRQAVEECENDTYFRAWNAIPPHRPMDYLFAFLARIMRHAVLNACTAHRRRRQRYGELTEELEQCLASSADPEDTVDGMAMGESVSAFLRTLPREQWIIFLRRYWYFDSVGEIARFCGISESKVKSVLFRIRNHLREHLKKEGFLV